MLIKFFVFMKTKRSFQHYYLLVLLIIYINFLFGCSSKVIVGGDYSKKNTLLTQHIVKTAQSQIGTRYMLGGTTPRGFDCSGLVWWAYKKHGICIPRLTEDQARAGIAIKFHAIKPGDIIIFKTCKGRSGLHSGLYTGCGRFIHSPRSGKHVRHDKIENLYWKSKLHTIRRIIQ